MESILISNDLDLDLVGGKPWPWESRRCSGKNEQENTVMTGNDTARVRPCAKASGPVDGLDLS